MSLISERKKEYKDRGYTKSKVNGIYVYKIIDRKRKKKKIMLIKAKYSCLLSLSPTPRHTILVLAIGAAAKKKNHFFICKKYCFYKIFFFFFFFFFFQLVHQARDAFTYPHTLLYIRKSIDNMKNNMNMINA
jgi:hypothetical protein